MFSTIRVCQNCSSYVLKPKKKINANLDYILEKLKVKGFKIIAFTGTMISAERICKINIYASGKTVIVTKDITIVNKLKEELSNILYEGTQSTK